MKSNQTGKTWEDILDIFISDIKKQKYGKDQKIPAENETAAKYGVTRNEVRMVYKKLKEMGYIYSIQGHGSFYSGRRIKIPLSMVRGASFSTKMQELGIPYHTDNVKPHIIHYNPNIYESLHAAEGDIIWKISLLRVINNEPAAVHIRYMPQKYFPDLPSDAAAILSSRDYLQKNGYLNVHNADGQMAVTAISKKRCSLLNMKYTQEALVFTGKTINGDDDTVLELFCTTYRSDSFIFTFS